MLLQLYTMELLSVSPGKYIIAVSGGVDSMVLLDLLARQPDLELIVAHFDHGIRADSEQDRELVEAAAKRHRFPFMYATGGLSPDTSEAEARTARYQFLNRTKTELQAQAIITAHHQDDVIETMCINLIRGTGRKGLASLRSSATEIIRPLLNTPKAAIQEYAKKNQIAWREDSTNSSEAYLRNRLRLCVLSKMSQTQRQEFIAIYKTMCVVNDELDGEITQLLQTIATESTIERSQFVQLPHAVAVECLLATLRRLPVRDLSRKRLEQLVVAAKTASPGQSFDLDYKFIMKITRKKLIFELRNTRKSP